MKNLIVNCNEAGGGNQELTKKRIKIQILCKKKIKNKKDEKDPAGSRQCNSTGFDI